MICFNLQLTSDNEIDWAELPIELDVDSETQPRIELDVPDLFTGSYTDDTIYNVTFPLTSKNYRILGSIVSGVSFKMDRQEFNVFAVYNGEIMNIDKMYAIKNSFNNDGRFEVQLYKSTNWVKAAISKKLNTIEVVPNNIPITHVSGNIDIMNALGPSWADNTFPVRYPLVLRKDRVYTRRNIYDNDVQYGEYFITESDLVPYVSLWRVLFQGFKEIGWKFSCPLLESENGRKIWVDLCSDDFPQSTTRIPFELSGGYAFYGISGNTTQNNRFRWFPMFQEIDNLSTQSLTHEISFKPTSKSGWYSTNKYTEPVVIDLTITFNIKRISPIANYLFKGDVKVRVKIGNNIIGEYDYFISDGTTNVSIDLSEIEINPRDYFNMEIGLDRTNGNDGYLQVADILILETKLHKRFLNSTSFYKVQDLFYKEDTLYQLLKGFAQMIYGKIDKDDVYKKITLYSPYEHQLDTETIDGFYKKEISELTDIAGVEIDSYDTERKRYLNLSFADSKEKIVTDLYVEDTEKYIDKFGLHGIFVDFGDKFEKSVEPFKNEYFVPTYTPENTFHMCPIAGFSDGTYQDKGRRIVFAIGSEAIGINKVTKDGIEIFRQRDIKVRLWKKDNTLVNPFWVFQSISEEIYNIPGGVFFLHLAFSTKKIFPDYEDVYPNLYDLIIKTYAITLISSQGGIVTKLMKSPEFSSFDKRKQYYFNIKDLSIMGYVTKINGYSPCEIELTSISFIVVDKFRQDPITTSNPPTFDRPYSSTLDFYIKVTRFDCDYFITLEFL